MRLIGSLQDNLSESQYNAAKDIHASIKKINQGCRHCALASRIDQLEQLSYSSPRIIVRARDLFIGAKRQADPSAQSARHFSRQDVDPFGVSPSMLFCKDSPAYRTSTCRQTEGSSKPDNHTRDAATVSENKGDQEAQERFADDGHTLMSEQEKEILDKLKKNFPGGTVAVQDVSGECGLLLLVSYLTHCVPGGCGTFFAISVESDRFKGLTRIKQHQLVNKVLEDEVKTWHGMQVSWNKASSGFLADFFPR